MLEEAKRLSAEGKRVCVMAANYSQADYFRRILADMFSRDGLISLKPPKVESVLHDSWSWHERRVEGLHHDTVYLVDHWAIEQRYAKILEELHRFDPELVSREDCTSDRRMRITFFV
jgi:hypothetical protein